jgi:hypothetical protein
VDADWQGREVWRVELKRLPLSSTGLTIPFWAEFVNFKMQHSTFCF